MAKFTHLPNPKGLKTKRLITWLVLLWEAFWVSTSQAAAVVCITVAAGFFEIPQTLGAWFGGWFHAIILAVLLGVFLWTLRCAVIHFSAPNSQAVNRRLEASSGLENRPLTTLTDNLVNSMDRRTRRLWDAHRRRVLVALHKLKVGPPKPILSTLDPFAIRAAIGIFLIVSIVAAWANPLERLMAAVTPSFSAPASTADTNLDVWINPPSYTGQPPLLLSRKTMINPTDKTDKTASSKLEVIAAPIASTVLAAVTGGTSEPTLAIETATSAIETFSFETIGPGNYQLKAELKDCVRLSVSRNGTEIARWALNIIPDLPPKITFNGDPTRTQRDSLMIRYEAKDDHGVIEAMALIKRLDEQAKDVGDEEMMIPMPLLNIGEAKANGQSLTNLTPHPWAGHPVRIRLRATDKIGQNGFSASIEMILPERVFHNPVARAVIKQRKRLLFHDGQRQDIASIIMTIAASPHTYEHDTVAFIGLKSAALRLDLNGDGSEDESVSDLLWNVALRIEDGELSLAERRLRELQKELEAVLAANTSDDQIEKLISQMKDAIDKYHDAMAKQAQTRTHQRRSEDIQQLNQENELRRQDLQNLVEKMHEMVKGGARDAAREMLSRLQKMMENMRIGQQHTSPQQRVLQEMMRQLNDLTRRQQELLDKTFQKQQRQRHKQGGTSGTLSGHYLRDAPKFGDGPPRKPNSGPSKFELRHPSEQDRFSQMGPNELAKMQEQLRRTLGEFIHKISEGLNRAPDGFGRAERSMKEAVRALKEGTPSDATGPQADAIGQIGEGARSLADILREQLTNGQGRARGQALGINDSSDLGQDPLNRRRDGHGNYDYSTIGIPEQPEIQKARRIFDELRRRSNDRSRPDLELDYLNRLLRRF